MLIVMTLLAADLDFEVFKMRVQPVFLQKRKGLARCYACHSQGTPFRLQLLSPGSSSWTDEESRPLLDYLYRHAVKPEFTCRFRWREGSLALWDNRSTWHFAVNDYHGERRLLHRITIQGTPLH